MYKAIVALFYTKIILGIIPLNVCILKLSLLLSFITTCSALKQKIIFEEHIYVYLSSFKRNHKASSSATMALYVTCNQNYIRVISG